MQALGVINPPPPKSIIRNPIMPDAEPSEVADAALSPARPDD